MTETIQNKAQGTGLSHSELRLVEMLEEGKKASTTVSGKVAKLRCGPKRELAARTRTLTHEQQQQLRGGEPDLHRALIAWEFPI